MVKRKVKEKYSKKRIEKKRNIKKYFLIVVSLSVFLLFYSIFIYTISAALTQDYVKMSVEKVDYIGDSSVIYLKGNCSKFSFYTTLEQGKSIEMGLYKISTKRPMTHDIIVTSFEKFGIKPYMVKITKLSGNTYFAELILRKWFIPQVVDIRPSDAIAVAVRSGTPIYVNKKLVINVCEDFVF